jgi:hypothetical protein
MMWGDVARIHCWIKNSDLQGRSWELGSLILQCG